LLFGQKERIIVLLAILLWLDRCALSSQSFTTTGAAMSRVGKILLAACTGVVALMAFSSVGTASTGLGTAGLLVLFSGAVTLRTPTVTIICNIWLGIQLNRSILKANGVIGTALPSPISRFFGCNFGITATIDNSIPYSMAAFTGTLPSSVTGFAGRTSGPKMFTLSGSAFGAGCTFTAPTGAIAHRFIGTANTVRNAGFATAAGGIPNGIPRPGGTCPMGTSTFTTGTLVHVGSLTISLAII
jgi:hypothetical protein